LKECPYIVIVSVGKHTHLPPPPSKPLITAVENLNKIMNNEDLLDLTARKLLTKPALKIYLNGAHISTLHPSFNKQSRLNYLIGKAKRTKYPFGQDIY
ncbi:9391_t:CDS:2, partial [Paraglomus brasilianum]